MRRLLVKARTRVGVAVIGAAVLAGAGSATAAVLVQPAASTSEDGAVFEAPATGTTEATAPETVTPGTADVAEPAPDTSAATVDAVTEPEPATAPVLEEEPAPAPVDGEPQVTTPPAPGSYDPMAPFTDDAGLTYLPGPDAPAEPLPGEPGYTPPAG